MLVLSKSPAPGYSKFQLRENTAPRLIDLAAYYLYVKISNFELTKENNIYFYIGYSFFC